MVVERSLASCRDAESRQIGREGPSFRSGREFVTAAAELDRPRVRTVFDERPGNRSTGISRRFRHPSAIRW
jgi:hypothetical protein